MSKEKVPEFSHNHNLLKVRGCSSLLDVLCFDSDEELSKPFSYIIEFTSVDKAITPQQMLMKAATFTLQAEVDQGFGSKIQQPVRTIQGVVTAFQRISASKDEAHYALTLQPRLALLARGQQNRIYQDMSVPQIVEHILRSRHGMRGQDFVFTLVKEYPRREQVMQFGEDDLHFITRLLGEVGIWFRFTADTRLNIDVVAFHDDRLHYQQGLTLPFVPPSGQYDGGIESVWGLASDHHVVEQSVYVQDYNYRDVPQKMGLAVDVTQDDITTYGEAYHWADNYQTLGEGNPYSLIPESGAFYARLRHERYLNGQTRLKGKTSSAALAPGLELVVTGGIGVTETFREGVVITRMSSRAHRDKDYEVSFEAIPVTGGYCFRPELVSKPVMAGTLPARVTSTQTSDIYGHIDRNGRYKVNLLFDRDTWRPGGESLWVRQARPYAGSTYGLHLPLIAGTEVAIAFEQGDPDRPYIAGVLHDSAHPDLVTIQNYKRNVLRTPANNKIRLDDTRDKEHIKVSTEFGGKSQLNLGHLVNGEKQPRGEGAELRTDDWVAVRGGKGVLITTQTQPKAAGQQLDMDEIKRQLSDALSLAESLSSLLQTAQLEPLESRTQQDFLQQSIEALQQPAIVAGAPGGIALSTPRHLQFSANGNQIMTAGGSTEISSLRRMALVAKRGMVAFAHELGMKLVAAAGKVTLQAQSDGLELTAMKEIVITSTQDEIVLSAPKKITLQCGGSYLTLSPDKIEHGSSGDFKVKTANFDYAGPANMDLPYPKFTVCEAISSDAAASGSATVPMN